MNDKLVSLFEDLAEAYVSRDAHKSAAFDRVAESIARAPFEIKTGKDILTLKGCGQSSAEIVDEFLKTGACARLEELKLLDEDLDFYEQCDRIEQKRRVELDLFKIPRTVEDAQAFIVLEKRCPALEKQAKQILKNMDEVLKVYVAEQLRDYLPMKNFDNDRCDYCDLILDESHAEECTCSELRTSKFLESIGCEAPEIQTSS